jgi:hypothetical protein
VAASLEIYLGAATRTRLGVGPRSNARALVRRLAGSPEVPIPDPAFSHLSLHAADPVWARALVQQPAARDALLRLAADPSGGALHLPSLEPEAVVLRISGAFLHTISPGAVRRWADDLATLARAAEHLPPPAEALASGALERAARSRRGGLTALVVIVVLTLLAVAAAGLAMALMMGTARR